MEVRCSNCSTEYEFDDALVSARGTSVKCTNCGHQFRVHATNAAVAQEKWVVRDSLNRETTFTSLRDLQQAIVKGELNPQHQLSHAGKPFRPLEDIYELSTFFNAARQRSVNRPAPRTLLGVGRDGQSLHTPAPSQSARVSPPPSPPRRRGDEPVPERITPVAGHPAVNAALPGDAKVHPTPARATRESGSRPSFARPSSPAVSRPSSPAPAAVLQRGAAAAEAPSWQHLQGLHDDSELDEPLRRSGAGSRWILAVVLLGGLALVAGTVGRDYFLGFIRREPEAAKVDERVPALLEQARLALAKGDLENANAELAKASVLAPADPRVTAALARLELSRAELSWLELRLANTLEAARAAASGEKAPARRKKSDAELAAEAAVAQKQAAEKKQLEQSFKERMAKAKVAVAEAAKGAPTALEVVRAQVDALRLEGQVKQARALVQGLSAQASDPDNAYSLGALDLAEGEAGYPSAIDRLRVAARAEEALGKARPLLIYALAQSGDGAAASAELDKLGTVAPNHQALPALRGLVELKKGATVASAAPATVKAAAANAPAPRSSTASSPPPSSPASKPASTTLAPRPNVVDDVQASLSRASTLHRQGDLSGAESLYQGVVTRFPNNVTALSGLGDIARQRGENSRAAGYYDRILQLDRNHVPSVMGRADLHWHAGNREQAVVLYRRALGQVGPSDAFGQRALRRIEEFDRSVAEGTSAPEAESKDDGEGTEPASPGDEEAQEEPAPSAEPSQPPSAPSNRTTPGTPAPPADDTESSDEAPAEESADQP